ncbi:MAG: thioredoxin [bacterium]|nr:thioredoxin [bacterium]
MSEVVLTDKNFESEVLKGNGVVLVDFWAPWCGPCRMLGPVVEELAKDFEGKAKVGKVNVDESPQTAGQYGVMSIPTILIFKDGSPVETFVGVQPKEVLADKLKSLI